jgi:hypothetical protein
MTRHKHAQTGLVIPSPLDRWINATLRVFAMLLSNVASTLQMICRRGRVNATRATPTALPQAKTDTHQEPHAAQQSSQIALILRSAAKLRVSKDESVLTACHPGNAKRYPGPIVRARHAINGSRVSLRSPGMTTVGASETAQHARPINQAHLSLRSSRRKLGPRAAWVICVKGLHTQPCIPAFAGTSGTRPALHALS